MCGNRCSMLIELAIWISDVLLRFLAFLQLSRVFLSFRNHRRPTWPPNEVSAVSAPCLMFGRSHFRWKPQRRRHSLLRQRAGVVVASRPTNASLRRIPFTSTNLLTPRNISQIPLILHKFRSPPENFYQRANSTHIAQIPLYSRRIDFEFQSFWSQRNYSTYSSNFESL